jgi:hypothetical protein
VLHSRADADEFNAGCFHDGVATVRHACQ